MLTEAILLIQPPIVIANYHPCDDSAYTSYCQLPPKNSTGTRNQALRSVSN
ncbi:hypothetical protein AYX13_07063 [Cryptococcus neoformans]|nr:hypothetical protein AYX13_07063 [Cryptococcus neoformans var. grubii]